jgi:hypothetical protein
MVFGKSTQNKDNCLNILIQGTKLDIVSKTKFLGIILDAGLTWKHHITYITQKIAKTIGILHRARKFLNSNFLRQLYFSFLFPYLSYANIIWGNASQCHLNPIFKLQKRAIRTISNIKQRNSTKLYFHKLRLLRLPEIYKFSTMIFLYKYKNGLLPPTFNNFYQENREFHNYGTRSASNLRIPLTRTKNASSFVKKTGVSLWSEFSTQISADQKIGSYKRELISLLITPYLE